MEKKRMSYINPNALDLPLRTRVQINQDVICEDAYVPTTEGIIFSHGCCGHVAAAQIEYRQIQEQKKRAHKIKMWLKRRYNIFYGREEGEVFKGPLGLDYIIFNGEPVIFWDHCVRKNMEYEKSQQEWQKAMAEGYG